LAVRSGCEIHTNENILQEIIEEGKICIVFVMETKISPKGSYDLRKYTVSCSGVVNKITKISRNSQKT
jgi:hypothetical protein